MSAAAMGMFVGSLVAGSIYQRLSPSVLLSVGVFGFGIAMVWFSRTHSFYTALIALLILGACNAFALIGSSTLFQICTPNRLQARAIAMFWILYSAINLLSTYFATIIADFYSVRGVLLLCGVLGALDGILGLALLQRCHLDGAPISPESADMPVAEQMHSITQTTDT